ncbi:hypothetical protein FKM82_030712 [Ascaphus truei]
MEAAVLRVKRKRGAEPAEALILRCKKPRAEPAEEAEAGAEQGEVRSEEQGEAGAEHTHVFRLTATVTSQNEPLQKYIQEAISRDRATRRPSLGSAQRIQQYLRASKEAKRQESRYRLITSYRPNCEQGEGASPTTGQPACPDHEPSVPGERAEVSAPESGGDFQLFDMVQEEAEKATEELKKNHDPDTILCNSVRMIRERLAVSAAGPGTEHRESMEEYVYDIYYTESSAHGWIEDILSVQPYTQEQQLVDDDREPEETYEDEDDENEENNWRNEYPEEEDGDSDKEERHMGNSETNREGTDWRC